MTKKRISVKVDGDIINEVKKRCKELDVSMDYFVNNALVLVIRGSTRADFGLDD